MLWNSEKARMLGSRQKLFKLLHVERAGFSGAVRGEDTAGRRESADNGQIHATNNHASVDTELSRIAHNKHAFAIQLLGNAVVAHLRHKVPAELHTGAAFDQGPNRRMHLVILEDFLDVPAVLCRLLWIEDDAERNASLVGVEKCAAGNSLSAADGDASRALVIFEGKAVVDERVRKLDRFLHADADSIALGVRETGRPFGPAVS